MYEELASLPFPVQLIDYPDSDVDLVATKDGRVWAIEGGAVRETPVLDIRQRVTNQSERGLLAIAARPGDPLLYVHYSDTSGDTVVAHFTGSPGDGFDSETEEIILQVDQPAGNHNGGMIQFGPDGALYVGLGDGGGANDRFDNGQNQATLLGGIVRVDVAAEAEPTLYAYGLRNPWRFWIDGDTIYIGDVGQRRFEEVSVGQMESGLNYGWPVTEGFHCFRPASGCDVRGHVLPVVEVSHSDSGTCSITGGVVYRGPAIPELEGHFFYSDYCGGYLRSIHAEGDDWIETDWTDQVGVPGRVVSFGVGDDGEMYVMTTERVLKVVAVR